MDIQYTDSVVIKLADGTRWLEPVKLIDAPKSFKKYFANENESLFFIANRFYQETSMWFPIAKYSGVVDPTDIPIGTVLLLPVYEDKNPQDIYL